MSMNDRPDKLTRRGFCKQTSLAAGGAVLMSSLPAQVAAFGGGSDRLKLAVIGCGSRGAGAARQALRADEGTQLVAMADLFEDRLESTYESLTDEFEGGDRIDVPEERKFIGFDGYKQAIAEADVILLTTPPGFRPYHFEEAVRAGKHVFMEKPVATDAPGVRRVLEAGHEARRQRLNVVVGLQRRYQNNYREVYRRVRNQEIGRIVSGQVYWNSGGVWVRERKPEMTELEYQMRNWYYFNWVCGDHILEQHIHNIDVANWYIGEYPSSAQGMGGREVRRGKDHGQIFDHHFVEYTYPGGAVISSQCRHQPGCMNRIAETFQGTRGILDTNGSDHAVIRDWNGTEHFRHDGRDDPDPYQQEHDELFASIRAGDVIDDTDIGAKSTLAAIMGRMATYTGQVIEWDQAMASEELLVPNPIDWESEAPVQPDENGEYPVPVPGETPFI